MNNSFNVEFREETDETPLREREAKLVRTIEAFVALSESPAWSSLKQELFDNALESIETLLLLEAVKSEINCAAIHRLQGERKWAKRFCDPAKYVSDLRAELASIRKRLNPSGPTE